MADGRWITVNGTHIFIKNGQSFGDAFKETTGKNLNNRTRDIEKKTHIPLTSGYRNFTKQSSEKVMTDIDKKINSLPDSGMFSDYNNIGEYGYRRSLSNNDVKKAWANLSNDKKESLKSDIKKAQAEIEDWKTKAVYMDKKLNRYDREESISPQKYVILKAEKGNGFGEVDFSVKIDSDYNYDSDRHNIKKGLGRGKSWNAGERIIDNQDLIAVIGKGTARGVKASKIVEDYKKAKNRGSVTSRYKKMGIDAKSIEELYKRRMERSY